MKEKQKMQKQINPPVLHYSIYAKYRGDKTVLLDGDFDVEDLKKIIEFLESNPEYKGAE